MIIFYFYIKNTLYLNNIFEKKIDFLEKIEFFYLNIDFTLLNFYTFISNIIVKWVVLVVYHILSMNVRLI